MRLEKILFLNPTVNYVQLFFHQLGIVIFITLFKSFFYLCTNHSIQDLLFRYQNSTIVVVQPKQVYRLIQNGSKVLLKSEPYLRSYAPVIMDLIVTFIKVKKYKTSLKIINRQVKVQKIQMQLHKSDEPIVNLCKHNQQQHLWTLELKL